MNADLARSAFLFEPNARERRARRREPGSQCGLRCFPSQKKEAAPRGRWRLEYLDTSRHVQLTDSDYSRNETWVGAFAARRAASSSGVAFKCRGGREAF